MRDIFSTRNIFFELLCEGSIYDRVGYFVSRRSKFSGATQFPQSHDPFRLSTLNAGSSHVRNTGSQHVQEREREGRAGAINLLENFCNRTASQVAIGA